MAPHLLNFVRIPSLRGHFQIMAPLTGSHSNKYDRQAAGERTWKASNHSRALVCAGLAGMTSLMMKNELFIVNSIMTRPYVMTLRGQKHPYLGWPHDYQVPNWNIAESHSYDLSVLRLWKCICTKIDMDKASHFLIRSTCSCVILAHLQPIAFGIWLRHKADKLG